MLVGWRFNQFGKAPRQWNFRTLFVHKYLFQRSCFVAIPNENDQMYCNIYYYDYHFKQKYLG